MKNTTQIPYRFFNTSMPCFTASPPSLVGSACNSALANFSASSTFLGSRKFSLLRRANKLLLNSRQRLSTFSTSAGFCSFDSNKCVFIDESMPRLLLSVVSRASRPTPCTTCCLNLASLCSCAFAHSALSAHSAKRLLSAYDDLPSLRRFCAETIVFTSPLDKFPLSISERAKSTPLPIFSLEYRFSAFASGGVNPPLSIDIGFSFLKINLLICYRKWIRLSMNLFALRLRIKKFSSPKIKTWPELHYQDSYFCAGKDSNLRSPSGRAVYSRVRLTTPPPARIVVL